MKLTIVSTSVPIRTNWDEIENISIPKNFSGRCNIYVNSLSGDITDDIEKIKKLQSIPNLKEIAIHSQDFKVAEYFETVLRAFQVSKEFNLLNDYEVISRENIDFSNLNYNSVTVPFDYMMHMPNSKITQFTDHEISEEKSIFVGTNDLQTNYLELPELVNSIVDEIFDGLPMEELDDIDKSVLVANYIQKKMQFIEGKKSNVQGKKYICEEFTTKKGSVYDMLTAIKHNYGVCAAFAKLSVALLNNPKVNCQCHLVYSMTGGHTYFVQVIDGKKYIVDNTWGITRNPNKMEDSLKAKSFSDEYLLIGNDKLNETEDIRTHHISYGVHEYKIEDNGISRDRIQQSVEKLKGMGVEFEYNVLPAIEQYIEDDREILE